MTNADKLLCPVKDRSKCQLEASLELSGDRGILQVNCHTCGHGQAIALPAAEALELHDEMHRHVEPPKPPEAANDETASGGKVEPGAAEVTPPTDPLSAIEL